MRSFIILMFIVSLAGCGSKANLKKVPVAVSGTVSQGGQPVGGMIMIFQPLGDGHVREFPVQKDGTFNGELISGKYAYYVAKPAVPAAAQMLRNLPPKFFAADLSRTVAVESGSSIAIELN
jgi:hypothetical protein